MSQIYGKRVLLTGAAGGVGRVLAEKLSAKGARLILLDVNEIKLKELSDALSPYGDVEYHTLDISDKSAVDHFSRDIIAGGGLDILINNAGIAFQGELPEMTMEDWQKLFAVNFWGPLYLMYAFLDHFKAKESGHIVNVSSGQAALRLPTWAAYAATKLAFGAVSESIYYDLIPYNVKVSTVYPYMINTPFYQDVQSDTLAQKLAMQLVPFYSNSPETVADKMINDIEKNRRVDMVHPINWIAHTLRSVPPAIDGVIKLVSMFMLKDGGKLLQNLVMGIFADLRDNFKLIEGLISDSMKSGFEMTEIMQGSHTFIGQAGPPGELPLHFRVKWGHDDLVEWADPSSENFMRNSLKGTVSIGGWADDIPCEGWLEMKYFSENKIRYVFNFTYEGKEYEYTGEKRNIQIWNLPKTHTTCYGQIVEKETGRVVSDSTTYFKMNTLVPFIKSLQFYAA